MWALGTKAEKASKLPSECIPDLDAYVCDWTIWQLDNAIVYFMQTIRNALEERFEIGSGSTAKMVQRYTLGEILHDGVKIERNPDGGDLGLLKSVEGAYDEVNE